MAPSFLLALVAFSLLLILPILFLNFPQAVGKIVSVAIKLARGFGVEEAFALDEVDKHETVEHEGGVPFAIGLFGDAFDEGEEAGVLDFETVIEFFGDALFMEGIAHALCY